MTRAHADDAAEIDPGIVVDPDLVHGKPVIAGTRAPIVFVLGQLAGESVSRYGSSAAS